MNRKLWVNINFVCAVLILKQPIAYEAYIACPVVEKTTGQYYKLRILVVDELILVAPAVELTDILTDNL